jgi:hypothetical protein
MPVNALPVPVGPPVGGSDSVRAALSRLTSIGGLVVACLIEPDSAYVVDAVVGDVRFTETADVPAAELVARTVAAGASDVAQVISLMTASLGDPDELEDVIITLGRHHHLITPLPAAGANGLLIVVILDRARTNLALARQQLRALGPLLEYATDPGRVS